ncbi:SIR2 family protein [Rhizobium leguminosarum]|uniref:SIR2 family protein n=1 Tax=Rhizobium TaxID=379 RepID=UPI00140FF51C|nr:SIR2 family protein [Rhizobium leguminosarum]QIO64843.1 hypothetical protein HA462_07215 [Rhizobium leguminosarum bv. trifolii]
MPTFVSKGPFVPDRLVQQLEDDKVVIFCGAGISMGAGLPSYAGLVEYCYNELGLALPPNKSAEWAWPDRMLGVIESKFSSAEVRRKVAERLDLHPTDLDMHRAILRLASIRQGNGLRLVTTNFDTFFEHAQGGMSVGRDLHSGPVLPIPRNDRIASWRSIVYLHGRLAPVHEGNDHLVLTSGDFGRAYLTEAWAARFVARLFSDFTVLFIGYSLNDPVLRYMTDAFAAEEIAVRGRAPREPAYIFLSYSGRTQPDRQPWIDRKLEPIFYHKARNHALLKKTLVAWAEARQDYLKNTQLIIQRIAPGLPATQHPSDVENLLWAVVRRPDDNGHGAHIFASLNPSPPIEWLKVLEQREDVIAGDHLTSLAAARSEGREEPPSPTLHLRELFPFVRGEPRRLSSTAEALITWLVSHLGSIELIDWVIEKLRAGQRPHPELRIRIRARLVGLGSLAAGYALFWKIVSAEGDWAFKRPSDQPLWDPYTQFSTDPEAPIAERELEAALRPVLTLDRSFLKYMGDVEAIDPKPDGSRLSHVANAEVEFRDEERLQEILDTIDALPDPDAFWAARLDLLTSLLRGVLELYAVAGEADATYDASFASRPSIEPHVQNFNHKSWAKLFDLIWRGWQRLEATDATLSREFVARWRRIPYLGFQRLALAAAGQSAHVTIDEKLEALLNG